MKRTSLLLVVLLLSATLPAVAEEAIEEPAPLTEPGELPRMMMRDGGRRVLPLEHTSVHARATGHVARVEVTQRYSNPHDHAIEAVYVFPLPERAAVDDFKLVIAGRSIEGVIEPREEARRTYERARRAGNTAALLEQERPNVFTQSVANIPAGEGVDVVVRYVQLLTYDRGRYEFVFPMTVGPRYVPGPRTGQRSGPGTHPDTSAVPDASRISPPYLPGDLRSGHDISIDLEIQAGLPIQQLDAPTHEVRMIAEEDLLAVRLAQHDTVPNRDFVFRWKVAAEEPVATILSHRGSRGGFFSLILQPPDLDVDGLVGQREVVFVVDVSGSMHGLPLQIARQTMREALGRLRPVDTFNLITFAGTTRRAFSEPRKATPENLDEALGIVDGLRAGGGTELLDAVRTALSLPREDGRHRYVIFLTDGFVGNESDILFAAREFVDSAESRPTRARVFGLGIGSSPNRYLIDGLGDYGQGLAQYVTGREDPFEAVDRIFSVIDHPIFENVQLRFDGVAVHDVQPARTPDLFASRPLIFLGRYDRGGRATVDVSARAPTGRPVRFRVEVELPDDQPSNGALASLWAREKVRALLASTPERRLVREQVTRLGVDFRIMTPFTSFVAVDRRRVTCDGPPERIVQPVEPPEGVDLRSAGGVTAPRYAKVVVPARPIPAAPERGASRGSATRRPPAETRFGKKEEAGAERRATKRTGLLSALSRRSGTAAAGHGGSPGGLGVGGLGTPGGRPQGRRSPRPRVRARSVAVQGAMDEGLVQRIVRRRRNEVEHCYALGLRKRPRLYGDVVVMWVVGPAGDVVTASIAETTMGDAEVEQCLVTRVGRWRFPAVRGGGLVQVSFGWHFGPGRKVAGKGAAEARGDPAAAARRTARRVRVRSRAVSVRGGVARATAERRVRLHRGAVEACYRRALSRRPGLRGTVRVGWFVDGAGLVPGASVLKTTVEDLPMEQCLLAAIRGWEFPVTGGRSANLLFEWRLRPVP